MRIVFSSIICLSLMLGCASDPNKGKEKFITLTSLAKYLRPIGDPPTSFNENTLVLFFNSNCDHCQDQMSLLNEKWTGDNKQLWLVSIENPEVIKLFIGDYPNLKSPTLFQINPRTKSNILGDAIPISLMYRENQLVDDYIGEVEFKVYEKAFK